jgi:hypothetical protein
MSTTGTQKPRLTTSAMIASIASDQKVSAQRVHRSVMRSRPKPMGSLMRSIPGMSVVF